MNVMWLGGPRDGLVIFVPDGTRTIPTPEGEYQIIELIRPERDNMGEWTGHTIRKYAIDYYRVATR